jgi:DNA polymerase elongation subunit (family B)
LSYAIDDEKMVLQKKFTLDTLAHFDAVKNNVDILESIMVHEMNYLYELMIGFVNYNSLQNALKISANAVYGSNAVGNKISFQSMPNCQLCSSRTTLNKTKSFLFCKHGPVYSPSVLQCIPVAKSVAKISRCIITEIIRLIRQKSNTYVVRYSDTDSCIVDFNLSRDSNSFNKTFVLAEELCDDINARFENKIRIVHERTAKVGFLIVIFLFGQKSYLPSSYICISLLLQMTNAHDSHNLFHFKK